MHFPASVEMTDLDQAENERGMQQERYGQPRLIFLLSLPRAGSTLMERLLRTHQDVAASSEPYTLLFLLLGCQEEGAYSLGADRAYHLQGYGEFVKQLPNAEQDYLEEVAEFARRLYGKSMKSPAAYFLDKSPDYCLVARNLLRLSSSDKYIFLWRNPLSVAASWLMWPGANHRQWNLYRFPHLFSGLGELVAAYVENRDRAFAVRYEDLVASPQAVLADVLDYLELPDDPGMAERLGSVTVSRGDPNALSPEFQTIRSDRVERWKQVFNNPLRKRWARRYLRWIGKERLAVMGYDLDEILAELDSTPTSFRLLGRDAYWMTYGFFYRLLNGRILRDNLRKWRAGEPFWAYR